MTEIKELTLKKKISLVKKCIKRYKEIAKGHHYIVYDFFLCNWIYDVGAHNQEGYRSHFYEEDRDIWLKKAFPELRPFLNYYISSDHIIDERIMEKETKIYRPNMIMPFIEVRLVVMQRFLKKLEKKATNLA